MEKNKNLRILCLAYSNGRIDRRKYQHLRAQQLSAIEFNKDYPAIPVDLTTIVIPKKKIELARGKKNGGGKIKLILALAIVAVAAIGVYLYSQHTPVEAAPSATKYVKTISQQAQQIVENEFDQAATINAFSKRWDELNQDTQTFYRQQLWYKNLHHSLQQSIKTYSKVQISSGLSNAATAKLNNMQQLYHSLSGSFYHYQTETTSQAPNSTAPDSKAATKHDPKAENLNLDELNLDSFHID